MPVLLGVLGVGLGGIAFYSIEWFFGGIALVRQ